MTAIKTDRIETRPLLPLEPCLLIERIVTLNHDLRLIILTVMKKSATKTQLVEWLGNFHNNCGFTDYFGYKMSIEDFKKEMMKKKAWELSEIVYSTSDEGQKFIESFE